MSDPPRPPSALSQVNVLNVVSTLGFLGALVGGIFVGGEYMAGQRYLVVRLTEQVETNKQDTVEREASVARDFASFKADLLARDAQAAQERQAQIQVLEGLRENVISGGAKQGFMIEELKQLREKVRR